MYPRLSYAFSINYYDIDLVLKYPDDILSKFIYFCSLFAGLAPRMGIMSVGSAIFLGLYDITKAFWSNALA